MFHRRRVTPALYVLTLVLGFTLGSVVAEYSENSCMLAEDPTEKTLVGLAYPPAVKSASDEKDVSGCYLSGTVA